MYCDCCGNARTVVLDWEQGPIPCPCCMTDEDDEE